MTSLTVAPVRDAGEAQRPVLGEKLRFRLLVLLAAQVNAAEVRVLVVEHRIGETAVADHAGPEHLPTRLSLSPILPIPYFPTLYTNVLERG